MVDVIFHHGGTLDKFIGDAIMALWGAPIPHEDDPDKAVQAAIGMQRALAAPQRQVGRRRAGRTIEVGIGINYGEAFAGNIGSHLRLEYTVIGDVVNVASRLCSNAKGGEILISDPLYQVLRDKPSVEAMEPLTRQEPGAGGDGVEGEGGDRGTLSCLDDRHIPRLSPNRTAPASSISCSTSRTGSPITPKKSPSIRSTSAAP